MWGIATGAAATTVDIALDIPGTVHHLRATDPAILAIARRLLAIGLRQTAVVLDIRGTGDRRQLRYRLLAQGIRTVRELILRRPRFRLPAQGIRTDLARIRQGHGRAAGTLRRNP
jgi:hypothetical protein